MDKLQRQETGIHEIDRVLGGGIVPGSLILLAGDPGIGKSTLLLQVSNTIGHRYGSVLYASGEESELQTKMRAQRLNIHGDGCYIVAETNLEAILQSALTLRPNLLVIDSIQTMCIETVESAPGSVSQVREGTARLLRFAKDTGIPVVIIGHVTKEGNIAGPRMLEHMVDVVLYFEGERNYHFRVLRVMKNRFGSTSETGIFGMDETGLTEVENPSALLLAERSDDQAGSVVIACMEGIRPLLVEVQALATPTVFGMPRRTAIGYDYNRLIILLAVLEKRIGLRLGTQDVYVNVIGGIRVAEPAADMAMALAITSSFRDLPIHRGTVVMGEVGLTGDVRMIPRVDMRIKEAMKMGFKRFIIPSGNKDSLKEASFPGCEIYGVRHILNAMDLALGKK